MVASSMGTVLHVFSRSRVSSAKSKTDESGMIFTNCEAKGTPWELVYRVPKISGVESFLILPETTSVMVS
jgi:hypothetical protein